jgi:hypothetical protein
VRFRRDLKKSRAYAALRCYIGVVSGVWPDRPDLRQELRGSGPFTTDRFVGLVSGQFSAGSAAGSPVGFRQVLGEVPPGGSSDRVRLAGSADSADFPGPEDLLRRWRGAAVSCSAPLCGEIGNPGRTCNALMFLTSVLAAPFPCAHMNGPVTRGLISGGNGLRRESPDDGSGQAP